MRTTGNCPRIQSWCHDSGDPGDPGAAVIHFERCVHFENHREELHSGGPMIGFARSRNDLFLCKEGRPDGMVG